MARTRLRFFFAIVLWLVTQTCQAAISPPPLPQPSWKELSNEQQRILAPLSGEWDQMEGFRRKKWLGIAQRYRSLSPEEQTRLQRRMTAWSKLSPEERKRARDQFLSLQKETPERKEAVKQKWEAYKELPEAEKARLKAEAAAKPTPRPAPSKSATPAPSQAKPTSPPATRAQQTPIVTPGPAIAR